MSNNRHDEAERYATAARKSMSHVAFEVFKSPSPCLNEDRFDEYFFAQRGSEDVRTFKLEQVLTILTMMDKDILIAIIEGTLPQRVRADLSQAMRNEIKQPDTIPRIYINYIVDKNGRHPTKADILAILDAMQDYINEFDDGVKVFSRVIDFLFKPKDPQGLKYCENPSQKAGAELFIEGMRDRLSSEPNGPLRGGISEVGFSINISSRLANHYKHQSSNKVMTLFDACAMHLFVDRYSIQGYPVVRIVSPHAVDMAECLISRLASSYVLWGWGFNANQAGASVQGVNSLKILQAAADSKGKNSWATIEAEASTAGITGERAVVEQRIKDSREEMADIIEEHGATLDANLAAQRRYHRQFKRLCQLASDEDDDKE
jgi:hypothetical protein